MSLSSADRVMEVGDLEPEVEVEVIVQIEEKIDLELEVAPKPKEAKRIKPDTMLD